MRSSAARTESLSSTPSIAVALTEVTWPFPLDQFGGGWAFQCKAADCGIEVNLYLRPKIGFCNCQTGVADDEELDRVGDVNLIGSKGSALGPGWPITVHSMKGRSRGYEVGAPSAKSVLSLAFNSRCDVTVATVVAGGDPSRKNRLCSNFSMAIWCCTGSRRSSGFSPRAPYEIAAGQPSRLLPSPEAACSAFDEAFARIGGPILRRFPVPLATRLSFTHPPGLAAWSPPPILIPPEICRAKTPVRRTPRLTLRRHIATQHLIPM
jgi:hypothetical protein